MIISMKHLCLSLFLLLPVAAPDTSDPAPSALCTDCRIWVNPYFTSIADIKKHNPVCVYQRITKQQLHIADSVRYAQGASFSHAISYHPLAGPGEAEAYQVQTGSIRYARGAMVPLNSMWTAEGITAAATYTYNTAPTAQDFNMGPKERLEHFIIDKVKTFGAVQVWSGTAGSLGSLAGAHGLSVNIPNIIWKMVVFNNETHCYILMNHPGVRANNEVSTDSLIHAIHFDPRVAIPH